MKEKVILDVDTGSDDAIAIMLAALLPEIELIGVSSVNGNRNIDITTENTLRVVELLNKPIKVYRGTSMPLVVSLTEGRRKHVPYIGPDNPEDDVHGDYLPLPEAKTATEPTHAVNWLVDTLITSPEPITLCFVGPLTNLAMALRLAPEIVSKVKRLVIMGGGYETNNVTAGAEFNFWIDPEAAKIVADSGIPMLIVPLDATHDAFITLDEALEMEKSPSKASQFCATLAKQRIHGYSTFQPLEVSNAAPIHDALAVAAIVDPEVLADVRETNMDIVVSPGPTDGMSLFDFGGRNRARKPNCKVALHANRERFIKLLMKTLSNHNN